MSEQVLIIDTRQPEEYASGHVEGAINIPPSDFMSGEFKNKLADTPKDARIILYCISGARSNACIHILRQEGYTNLTNGINMHQVTRFLA